MSDQKYELEDILEMLGGYEYFDYDQIQFVYHKVNNEEDKAKHYLDLCNEKNDKLKEMVNKLDSKVEKSLKAMREKFLENL